MSTPKMDVECCQQNNEEIRKKAEDEHRLQIDADEGLKINEEIRLKIDAEDLDQASVIKYDNGLAYHTANRALLRQLNAVCESTLTQTRCNSSGEKPEQQQERKARKPAKQPGNSKRPETTAPKEPEQPTSEAAGIVEKLSILLSTHTRLVTKLDGALDRLETLAGSKHRGYAGMRAWSYHFEAVAELVHDVANMERGIIEDEEIKAFFAEEEGTEKLNGV